MGGRSCVWAALSGRGSAVGDDTDMQRTHNVHPNQYRGRFETDEPSSPSRFASLQVEVPGFTSYLENFPLGATGGPLERLQGTPLVVVLPPRRESHAGHQGAGVGKLEDWDALEVELAGDGWPYCAPNRGHLGLR